MGSGPVSRAGEPGRKPLPELGMPGIDVETVALHHGRYTRVEVMPDSQWHWTEVEAALRETEASMGEAFTHGLDRVAQAANDHLAKINEDTRAWAGEFRTRLWSLAAMSWACGLVLGFMVARLLR